MKRNKGFTLIELLAVIVILGLLMAIAIPSVTKYITESRKKTLTTTVGNYISALVNEVNDLSYTFTGQNTIYAVPIECISLERGGTDPFGHWYQANDAYFAYVLIQYDDSVSKYIYGFTFKDSAGYGLYPTIQANIDEKGSQVKTGYTINKPVTGNLTSLVTLAKWQESGFKVDSSTYLQVLEATSENETGNGTSTCTLQQKGDNYAQIEEEKREVELNKPESEIAMIKGIGYESKVDFWNYKKQIKTITFEDSINIPNDAYEFWDVSSTGNGKVMAYIKKNVNYPDFFDLYIQANGKIYANTNSRYMFYAFDYVDYIYNMDLLDTSRVTNMVAMFSSLGRYSSVFQLSLGENFDTSNVTEMSGMFSLAGQECPVFTLDLGDKFDTSNVTNMGTMFMGTGQESTIFTLDLGDKFDTSNVTNMYSIFWNLGKKNPSFEIKMGNKFFMHNVLNTQYMFQYNKVLTEIYLNQSSLNINADMRWMFESSINVVVYVKTDADKELLDSKGFSNVTVMVKN